MVLYVFGFILWFVLILLKVIPPTDSNKAQNWVNGIFATVTFALIVYTFYLILGVQ